MVLHADPSEFPLSPALVAIAAARRACDDAALDTLALRRRVEALGHATSWSARATDAYHDGLADLCAELDRLVRLIDAAEDELSVQAQVERARSMAAQ